MHTRCSSITDISANASSADVAYSCMLNCNMKLSRKNKMISHTGCVNNKSTISIHLGTALTKFWSLIAFPLQHLLPQTSCCRFNSFQMIMVLLHDPVSSTLQPLLCFYNTLVYRGATWSVLWLYNAQVLLLPKPEVNDILRLRFVICGTMHPRWFHISKSESVPVLVIFQ